MSREWKPGDVAIRTGADGSTVTSLVVRADRRRIDCWDNHGEADHWHHSNGGWNTIPDDPAFGTYRPLVVIDPEDREQVERLRDIYDREVITQNGDPDPRDVTPGARGNALQAALREFADPKPPKPDEPTGLGAVVEDVSGDRWVRSHREPRSWTRPHLSGAYQYAEIDAVRVLSEGVTS